MIPANDLTNGVYIKVDGELYSVIEFQHYKPGKGGAFMRTRLRSLKLGTVLNKTFRSEELVEEVNVEEKKLTYMYTDDMYHFMDNDTYEQYAVSFALLGEKVNFIAENAKAMAFFYNGEIIDIVLPTFVNLKITHAEPGLRGSTVKPGTKPAQLETGAIIQVPLFINTGDTIRIDTRTGEYVERA